jgi:hypothetical protein
VGENTGETSAATYNRPLISKPGGLVSYRFQFVFVVNAVANSPHINGRHCPSCDGELAGHHRFCHHCGAATGPSHGEATESFEAPPQRAQTPPPASSQRFEPGCVVANRFRIVTILGKGGMGEVFRADDLSLGQSVALKFLPQRMANDPDRLHRLRDEVKTARRVAHPNVCRVYDLGQADGQVFLTMEFVDGQDLASLLKQIHRLPEERGVEIARQLCLGLGAIHDRGLLHRDLKPGNVMLDGRGQARIADFGLAVSADDIPSASVADGTPAYQSPEQLAGREVTARSDLYALGLILYEMFTGRRPFTATERAELARSHSDDAPSRPSSHVSGLSPAIEQTILRCLEKNPSDRPRSAYDVLAALPEGDPLRAALAAGQTPSPVVVANAKVEGTLHPLIGLALLLATLVGIAVVIGAAPQIMLFQIVPQPLSPRDLSSRARGLAKEFGYTDEPLDTAYGLNESRAMLDFLASRDRSAQRWKPLATGQPPAMFFWYRESPEWQAPLDRHTDLPIYRPGQVWSDIPAFTVPGMLRVCLDMKGRLIEFQVLPKPELKADPPPALDWAAILTSAGLVDAEETDERLPGWKPPLYVDERRAWHGAYSECPDIRVRAEAGLRGGRLVFFHAAPQGATDAALSLFAEASSVVAWRYKPSAVREAMRAGTFVAICLLGCALAWHNLLSGRANRRGTQLIGGVYFGSSFLAWLASAHHVPDLFEQLDVITAEIGMAAFGTALACMSYLALEPYVRRWWPWRVVAWNRLLLGRWRDSLVGRDVLVGMFAGTLAFGVFTAQFPVARWLQRPPAEPSASVSLLHTAGPAFGLSHMVGVAMLSALGTVLFLFVIYLLTRREWLAVIVMLAWQISSLFYLQDENLDLGMITVVFSDIIILAVLMRFGLLALASYVVAQTLLNAEPTLDLHAWYSSSSIVYLATLLALVLYGFVVSSGGGWLDWLRHITGEASAA